MLQAFHAIETGLRLHLDLQGKSVLRRATKGHLNSCKQTPHIGEQKLGILKKDTQLWSHPHTNTVFQISLRETPFISEHSVMVPTTDTHCFLNLPETATSLIKVPDTFSASRESAYERFN